MTLANKEYDDERLDLSMQARGRMSVLSVLQDVEAGGSRRVRSRQRQQETATGDSNSGTDEGNNQDDSSPLNNT
jgi:hypothetical protein